VTEAIRVKAEAGADKEVSTSLEDWVKAYQERVDEADLTACAASADDRPRIGGAP
jgi:hypothetical protein